MGDEETNFFALLYLRLFSHLLLDFFEKKIYTYCWDIETYLGTNLKRGSCKIYRLPRLSKRGGLGSSSVNGCPQKWRNPCAGFHYITTGDSTKSGPLLEFQGRSQREIVAGHLHPSPIYKHCCRSATTCILHTILVHGLFQKAHGLNLRAQMDFPKRWRFAMSSQPTTNTTIVSIPVGAIRQTSRSPLWTCSHWASKLATTDQVQNDSPLHPSTSVLWPVAVGCGASCSTTGPPPVARVRLAACPGVAKEMIRSPIRSDPLPAPRSWSSEIVGLLLLVVVELDNDDTQRVN